MQPGGRFVHDDYASLFPQILRKLDSLALSARQGAERLSQRQILESDLLHYLQMFSNLRILKQIHRL